MSNAVRTSHTTTGSLLRSNRPSPSLSPRLFPWISLQPRLHAGGSAAYSAVARTDTVELAYDVVEPPSRSLSGAGKGAAGDQVLVICHGLFGSKQNWRSLSKTFASRLGMPVYCLDLRNHGHSPHRRPHDYIHMAADVARFFEDRGLTKSGSVNLMGHSMGGKVAMSVALHPEWNSPLRTLVSADMAAFRGKISPEFQEYTVGMKEVEAAKVKTKSEADKILQKYEKALPTRQFLLTNTMQHPTDKHITFRIPLDILSDNIPAIGDFPFELSPTNASEQVQWNGPTLFVKGAHSKYINHKNLRNCRAFFPNMQLETLDAGHWVHAERPTEYVELVTKFIQQS